MKFLILIFLFLPFLPSHAFSQEGVKLTPVIIDDEYETKTIDFKDSTEKVKKTAGASDIILEQEWLGRRATTLQDIVEYSPSVFIQPRNGAEASRLSIRGSGLSSIYQGRGIFLSNNGIPITQADGEFEFQTLDPWLIQYALVRPGANSLEYGASNFGGAIDLITPTGESQQSLKAKYEAGSFQTHHALVSKGLRHGRWDMFGAMSYFSQEGFRNQNNQNSLRVNTNIGYQNHKNLQHRLYFNHTSSNAQIPGTLSLQQIEVNSRQGKGINVSKNYGRDLNISQIAYKNKAKFEKSEWENTLYYNYKDLDNPVFTYIYRESEDLGARTKFERYFESGQLTGGANFYYTLNTENRFENSGGNPGNFILERDTKALTGEFYTQYEHRLNGNLFVLANLQLSWSERTVDESLPVIQTKSQYYQGVNPRLGLRWEPNRDTQIFTNLSRSFEPPTLGEVSRGNSPGFRQLKAQKATIFETGFRTQWRTLNFQASYYHGWLEGELINYRFPDSTTSTVNSQKSSRDGLELGVKGNLTRGLIQAKDTINFIAAYTWSHFRLGKDPNFRNNDIPGLPEHFLRFEVIYQASDQFSIGPNFQMASNYSIDIANSTVTNVPSYYIWGARTKFTSKNKEWVVYLDANNITDRNYIATADVVPDTQNTDGNYYYPGEGFSMYLGVQWEL